MAPWPEQGSEPKAPDKDGKCELVEGVAKLDLEDRPEGVPAARTDQPSKQPEEKEVLTLDEGQLKALLDEAITYKNPKDREGKSELFKELLLEVEADESDSKGLANSLTGKLPRGLYNLPVRRRHTRHQGKECGVGVSTTRGGSLQNLNALGMEGSRVGRSRRSGRSGETLVSARQREGGSLPTNVNVDNDPDLDAMIYPNYTSRATLEVSGLSREDGIDDGVRYHPQSVLQGSYITNGNDILSPHLTTQNSSRSLLGLSLAKDDNSDHSFASSIFPILNAWGRIAQMFKPTTSWHYFLQKNIPPQITISEAGIFSKCVIYHPRTREYDPSLRKDNWGYYDYEGRIYVYEDFIIMYAYRASKKGNLTADIEAFVNLNMPIPPTCEDLLISEKIFNENYGDLKETKKKLVEKSKNPHPQLNSSLISELNNSTYKENSNASAKSHKIKLVPNDYSINTGPQITKLQGLHFKPNLNDHWMFITNNDTKSETKKSESSNDLKCKPGCDHTKCENGIDLPGPSNLHIENKVLISTSEKANKGIVFKCKSGCDHSECENGKSLPGASGLCIKDKGSEVGSNKTKSQTYEVPKITFNPKLGAFVHTKCQNGLNNPSPANRNAHEMKKLRVRWKCGHGKLPNHLKPVPVMICRDCINHPNTPKPCVEKAYKSKVSINPPVIPFLPKRTEGDPKPFVEKAYIRKVSKNHPDIILSPKHTKGDPKPFVEKAYIRKVSKNHPDIILSPKPTKGDPKSYDEKTYLSDVLKYPTQILSPPTPTAESEAAFAEYCRCVFNDYKEDKKNGGDKSKSLTDREAYKALDTLLPAYENLEEQVKEVEKKKRQLLGEGVGPVESGAMLYPPSPMQHVSVLSIPPPQIHVGSDEHRNLDNSEHKKVNNSRKGHKKGLMPARSDSVPAPVIIHQPDQEVELASDGLLGLPLTAHWNRFSSFTLLDFRDPSSRMATFGKDSSDSKTKSLDENGNALSCLRMDSNCLDRKKRRVKTKNDKNIRDFMSNDVEGFRGGADIETLMEYIESPSNILDGTKANKARSNQTNGSRNHVKVRAREEDSRSIKRRTKEKFQRCNSLEEISKTKLEDLTEESSSERVNGSGFNIKKVQVTLDDAQLELKSSWDDDTILGNSDNMKRNKETKLDKTSQDGLQESEFHVVTKKQRKRKRRTGCSGRVGSKPVFYGARGFPAHDRTLERDGSSGLLYQYGHGRSSQSGSQPRRKSASSVPPSDKSDSSDLDSVHSLPVSSTTARTKLGKNSVSGGSTPQASYADIAKTMASPPDTGSQGNICKQGKCSPYLSSAGPDFDMSSSSSDPIPSVMLPTTFASPFKKDAMTDTNCDTIKSSLPNEEYPPLEIKCADLCIDATVKHSRCGPRDNNIPDEKMNVKTVPINIVIPVNSESGDVPRSLPVDVPSSSVKSPLVNSNCKRPPVILMDEPMVNSQLPTELTFGFEVNQQLLQSDYSMCNLNNVVTSSSCVGPAAVVPSPPPQHTSTDCSLKRLVQFLSSGWDDTMKDLRLGRAIYYNGQ